MPRLISEETAAGFLATKIEDRICRRCGCTDADCTGCVVRNRLRCWWIEADLCSGCAPVPKTDALYGWKVFCAQSLVARLQASDLIALAFSAKPRDEELDLRFVLDIYFAARRNIAPHRNPAYPAPCLTVATEFRVACAAQFFHREEVASALEQLENLAAEPQKLRDALSGPSMTPFVYTGPVQPRPKRQETR